MYGNPISESDLSSREYTPKVWGMEEQVVSTPTYTGKLLWFAAGHRGSLHYHPLKEETFMCVQGTALVEYGTVGGELRDTVLRGWARDVLHLPPMTMHRVTPLSDVVCLIEWSSRHDDADVVRLEESV